MGGGGGSQAPAPVAPTYTDPTNGMTFTDTSQYTSPGDTSGTVYSGADALNAEIRDRNAKAKADSDAAQIAADDKTANDKIAAQNQVNATEAQFQNRFQTAKTQAANNARSYIQQQGFNPDDYQHQIDERVNTDGNDVVDLAPNPSASFSRTTGADILNDMLSSRRGQASDMISSIFKPTWSADHVTDDWINPVADTAIASQFDPLSAQLDNAHKRGTLNDTGYAAALKSLADKQTAARSTISSLGSNILASDRKNLDDYIGSAKNDASNLSLNNINGFDPVSYEKGATQKADTFHNNFAGDLTNAIGSTSFADYNGLLNAGGAVQGATDPTAANPATGAGADGGLSDAFIAQQALASQKRGLGSTGAF